MNNRKPTPNIAKESQAVDRVAQVSMVMNLLAGDLSPQDDTTNTDASEDVELESAKWAKEVDNFFE
jgi:hypothetical protein